VGGAAKGLLGTPLTTRTDPEAFTRLALGLHHWSPVNFISMAGRGSTWPNRMQVLLQLIQVEGLGEQGDTGMG
jgi:hypothetical protein